jgi:hypothetical protein
VSGGASLLHTRYLGVTGLFSGLALDGRAQPFAPRYKLSAAIEYRQPAGWPNFPNQSFLQLGDPRQVGITIDYRLRPRDD